MREGNGDVPARGAVESKGCLMLNGYPPPWPTGADEGTAAKAVQATGREVAWDGSHRQQ